MGPQGSDNDDGDELDDCASKDPSEPSGLSSILSEHEHSQLPLGALFPATTIRSRPIRRESSGKVPTDLCFTSSIDSKSGLTNMKSTSFKQRNVVERRDSSQGQFSSSPAPRSSREDNNEESTITTAANDEPVGDSADSVVRLGDPSSNLFQLIAQLATKMIGFQINLFIRFITSPMWFLYNSFMFSIDPFRKFRVGKTVILWILPRVWGVFYRRVSPLFRWLKERTAIWKVALRCGWSFLWLIYVCCILLSLLVSSLVISGFMMKYLSEEPFMKREILNFDYTKQSPVAYVPLISCSGVGAGNDWENNIADSKRIVERVIPTKRKVQVMVSLLVPESEYNKKLGVFQIRVDFLSLDGKIIASSSMPYMLRFRSGPIRLILSFIKIAPLITGYFLETQTLNVNMKDFIERDVPTSCLKVTLEQRATFQSVGGIPELYNAYLVLESKLPLFKWITWHWKKTVFIWITMMTFTMESLFVLLCCRPIIIPIKRQRGGSANQNNLKAQS